MRWKECMVVLCVFFSVVQAGADLPQSSGYLFWGPHEYDVDPQGNLRVVMWNCVSPISSYVQWLRVEDTVPNGAPNVCTLDQLKSRLEAGKGIVLYSAHGNGSTWIAVDNFGTDYEARDRQMAAYVETYGDQFLLEGEFGEYPVYHYFIKIHSAVTTWWCQQFTPYRHGLSLGASCGSGALGYNAFNSLGGFGYMLACDTGDISLDVANIFGRLNGSIGSGLYRTASSAITHYDDPYDPEISLYGTYPVNVRLCPTVSSCPSHGTYPPLPRWDDTGNIQVTFSDSMEVEIGDLAPVSVSLPWTDCAIVPGVNHVPRWTTDNVIIGSFKDATSGDKTMTVNTSSVRAEIINGSIYADGDPVTAQNQDPYVATFTIE